MNNSIVAHSAPQCQFDLDSPGGQANQRELLRRAIGHALSLIGQYQACNRAELIRGIRSLNSEAWLWILASDTEQLRSRFLPGDIQLGLWHSVDVMCPVHGRN